VGLHIKGPLPEQSGYRFIEAMNDTHISGLIEHCVEVLVWRRTIMGFTAGVAAGILIGYAWVH
jgi:hypothetical protein